MKVIAIAVAVQVLVLAFVMTLLKPKVMVCPEPHAKIQFNCHPLEE